MSRTLPTVAKTKLSYPLYGADFDPLNSNFLLVGGGGGEGRSGVGNKITLLDTSKRSALSEVVDIDLSRDEDSVTSLAVAQSTDTSMTAFAGINSSSADQKAGKNEHFRSFRLHHPAKKSLVETEKGSDGSAQTEGKTEALGRTSFFKPPTTSNKEAYQRKTCLSPAKKDQPRICAISTGISNQNEIVVLRAVANPQKSDELVRISMEENEVVDLDIRPPEEDSTNFLLAFCTDYDVFAQPISSQKAGTTAEAKLLYSIPAPDGSAKSAVKPKFRSLRFLSPRHLLLVQNLPQKSGTELLILALGEEGEDFAAITFQKRLGLTKAAVALDVCKLTKSPSGDYQSIIAVAGHTGTIEMLSIEYSPQKGLGAFKPFQSFKDVHQGPITELSFSNYLGPDTPVSTNAPTQMVKLASVSAGQTVVVHTLPLQPYPPPSNKNTTPRYVLSSPSASSPTQAVTSVFMAVVVIAFAAFLLQAFAEVRGAVPATLGAADWLNPRVKDFIHRPYISADSAASSISSAASSVVTNIPSDLPSMETVKQKLHEIVAEHASAEVPKTIIVREGHTGDLSTEVKHAADVVQHETLKKWDDLNEHEKEGWKTKLIQAGQWSVNEGETVLKSIMWSEYAGFVGGLVGG